MTIIDFIKENALISPGDRVLCAVSGGADSMCLLHYLSVNAKKLDITVCAASFDHMLRGEASASDCRFVAEWCENHSIELPTAAMFAPLQGAADLARRRRRAPSDMIF